MPNSQETGEDFGIPTLFGVFFKILFVSAKWMLGICLLRLNASERLYNKEKPVRGLTYRLPSWLHVLL